MKALEKSWNFVWELGKIYGILGREIYDNPGVFAIRDSPMLDLCDETLPRALTRVANDRCPLIFPTATIFNVRFHAGAGMSFWLDLHQEAGSGWRIIVAPPCRRRSETSRSLVRERFTVSFPSLWFCELLSYLALGIHKEEDERERQNERETGRNTTQRWWRLISDAGNEAYRHHEISILRYPLAPIYPPFLSHSQRNAFAKSLVHFGHLHRVGTRPEENVEWSELPRYLPDRCFV